MEGLVMRPKVDISSGFSAYQCSEPGHCEMPPRSRLYHLTPMKVGTSCVESFTGYVARLAQAHSVATRTLVVREILPLLNRPYLSNPSHHNLSSVSKCGSCLNGTLSWASDWVDVLEMLTVRNDLRFLTMLLWAEVLPVRGLMRRTRAWCPECYENWRGTSQVVYVPLLWALEVVTTCPEHQRQLQLRCPYEDCQRLLPGLDLQSRPGYCSSCGRWLGSVSEGDAVEQELCTADESGWSVWVCQAVGELLAATPTLSNPPRKKTLVRNISALTGKVMGGNASALARLLGCSPATVRDWRSGKVLPRLNSLLRMCYSVSVSPLRFLTEDIGESISREPRELPGVQHGTGSSPRSFDWEALRRALEVAATSDESPPPSMAKVAERLGHDLSHLLKLFPDLCRQISQRYRNRRETRRIERECRIHAEIRQAVLSVHAQGEYPSYDRVRAMLGNPNDLRPRAALAIWHETLRELGYS